MRDQLEKLRQNATPFDNPPAEARKGAYLGQTQTGSAGKFRDLDFGWIGPPSGFQGSARRQAGPRSSSRRAYSLAQARTAKTRFQCSAAKRCRQDDPPTKPRKPAKPVIGHAPIRLTHPDKILDAESHLTKQQLADYYWAIAPHMLPYVADRPLSLVRCPEGSGHPCFFQKHATGALPIGLKSVDVPDKKTGKIEPYITLSTPEALAGLAQMGVLEIHPWGSKNDNLERPDIIIFDLDPDAAISWRTLADSAADVRRQLKSLGLESFLKTTGGKGLHVVVPIEPTRDWSAVKQFAHDFALAMEQQRPQLYLTKMSKAARKGRIFIDYLRNERGSTAIAPYSPRARSGATVALPLSWSELKLPKASCFQGRRIR